MSSQLRWDRHFLRRAQVCAEMSKDPSTKVGAVIIGPDRESMTDGFNGFPRGIADTPERLHNRELKYSLVVHAEMNAVLTAARIGVSLKGCTLYLAAVDATDPTKVWGGPPCSRCTVEIIQTGIVKIVSWPLRNAPERWRASMAQSAELLREAGVVYKEVEPEHGHE